MSRWHTPDGPLHDFAGEAAERRSEAVDAMVEEWSHDADQIEAALLNVGDLHYQIADLMEYSNESIGEKVRLIVSRALTKRAEREIDA
jgi:hypothetical protein